MTLGELAWRFRSALRDICDIVRIKADLLPAKRLFFGNFSLTSSFVPGFSALPANAADDGYLRACLGADAIARLLCKGDEICQNRLSFFDLHAKFLGDPIDWHSDHSAGKRQPLRIAHLIDYRDFASVGDCKLVWEPNRHHQLVVLAQAFIVTRDTAYACKICELFDSWLEQNPFGYGMNWRSPLELGIRLINWVWALDLIRSSDAMTDTLWRRVRYTAYLACRDISRKYSQGSSSNNHLIGEAAGVFVAASWFADFPDAERLRLQSRTILEREILAQSYADGCTREQALGYQFFVLQFLTVSALVASRTGRPMSRTYMNRLLEQYRFVGFMAEGGADLPMFGDKDDGYVLDLGLPVTDPEMTIATGACLFGDAELANKVRRWPAELAWLFDPRTIAAARELGSGRGGSALQSRAFHDSGYYLLQSGKRDEPDALSVLFDCGEIGFGAIAAHGHADALSFMLRAAGKSIFVDTGTYDYFSHPHAREYFRSTRAHNTVEIDERSQSDTAGPFMWAYKAAASCLDFTDPSNPSVSGTHNGYQRLKQPVSVARSITLDPESRTICIVDRLSASARHTAKCFFHLDGEVDVQAAGSHEFSLNHTGTRLSLTVDARLKVMQCWAKDGDMTGWTSRNYHVLIPSTTIVGEMTFDAPIELKHEITLL